MKPVLSGVRVLDLTRNFAGPFCTMTLGDLGADVVKVEHPAGDDTRGWGPPDWPDGASASYVSANRNKRSIAVDLAHEDGLAVVRALAERADVLVESFKPGSLDKRGLGWDALHEANPRLVYCTISAYGPTGPLAERPGYDPVLQAFTGIMHITGEPDGPPVRLGVGALDLGAAMWATIGILSGIMAGGGVRVDASLLDTAGWWLSYHLGGYLASGVDPRAQGTTTGFIAPYESFPTADGDLFVAAPNDGLFRAFVVAVGAPELADDPRFVDNTTRVRNRVVLRDRLVTALTDRTAREWEDILTAAAVPCTRVRTVAELAADPQLDAAALVRSLPPYQAVDLPFRLDGTRASQWSPPPGIGEHTDEVLGEMGYDAAGIAALRSSGAVA